MHRTASLITVQSVYSHLARLSNLENCCSHVNYDKATVRRDATNNTAQARSPAEYIRPYISLYDRDTRKFYFRVIDNS